MSARIVILTGAGISAESGIRTFRGSDGLWENHRIEDVASPEGFARNPQLVHEFYNQRRRHLRNPEVQPNEAHKALVKLQHTFPGKVRIITQNIDDLHERAGAEDVIHMHGELLKKRCTSCGTITTSGDTHHLQMCTKCRQPTIRPHIVWFGEMPLYMERIFENLEQCECFAAIGTSGQVYPAAGFAQLAQSANAVTYQINLEQTQATGFDHTVYGKASETVPRWVATISGKA